jgi:peptidyl-prolyl cis-trans isomerase D
MLTTIREKTQGIIATFIIVLIAIPFALWGINSYFEGGSRLDVASINGEKISEQAYRSTLEGFRRQLDPRMADSPEVKRMVVDSLVEQTLLLRDAEERGFRLSDERLARTIRELPYFQNAGRFDPKLYESLLRREGIGVNEFEARRRTEAVTAQIQAGFVESGIVTATEVDRLVRLLQQRREVAYVTIEAERFRATTNVSEEEIQQYYNAHPELFRTQEQVRIEYVRLSAPELIRDYRPSEEELRRAYEEDSTKNQRPETRRAAHVLITLSPSASEEEVSRARAKIEAIEAEARGGADFAKLARTHSQDTDSAARGGDLGEIRTGVLPRALEEAVFALKPGELTRPVRTEYGYHLAKLTAYTPAVQRPFAEMKPQLEKQLRQRKGEERFYEASERFRNLAYEQADSLLPAAEALGLKVETSDWFGRSGGSGIAAQPRVVEAAFSPEVLEQKRNSDAIEVGGDTLVSIRIAGHRPAEAKPLGEVSAQIQRTLRQEAAEKTARDLGGKVVEELNAGQSLAAVARKHGLSVQGPKTLVRDQPQGFDRSIVEAVFRAPWPEAGAAVHGGVDLGSRGFAVYALTQVIEADPAKVDAETRDKARKLLAAQRGGGYYSAYRGALKQKADIKVHQDRL